jgi:hypothetical protein
MLADGLYSHIPKPDYAIALHDSADLEAGKVSYAPGYAMANSTSVEINYSRSWWTRFKTGSHQRSDRGRRAGHSRAPDDS